MVESGESFIFLYPFFYSVLGWMEADGLKKQQSLRMSLSSSLITWCCVYSCGMLMLWLFNV